MDLDKDDLIRNAAPGFVYLVVVSSFLIFSDGKRWLETNGAFVAALSGYPIGLIIQTLYRTLFHVGLKEQRAMESREGQIMRDAAETVAKITPTALAKYYSGCPRKTSLLFSLLLKEPGYEGLNERLNFLIGYTHSLGASMLAIFIGVWTASFLSMIGLLSFRVFPVYALTVFWHASIYVFWSARVRTKESYNLSIDSVIWLIKEDIYNALHDCRPITRAAARGEVLAGSIK